MVCSFGRVIFTFQHLLNRACDLDVKVVRVFEIHLQRKVVRSKVVRVF